MADRDTKGIVEPLRIGLTGGIASGKSTVADLFAETGIAVIDTDIIARQVVEPGTDGFRDVVQRFGENVVDAAGNLDRRELRRLIFADAQARLDLEAMLHPRIGEEVHRQSQNAAGPYQIIVVPLLVGSALLQFVDRVLVVDCSEDTQIQRLLARDAETIEQAKRILAAQSSRDQRLAIADDVIENNATLDALRNRVSQLDALYRRLAEACPRREETLRTD